MKDDQGREWERSEDRQQYDRVDGLGSVRVTEDWTDDMFRQWLRDTDAELLQKALADTLTRHLNTAAQQFGYDDIASAVSYAGDEIKEFDREGRAFKKWRSQCWAVIAGGGLTSVDEMLARLPKLELSK